MPWNLNFIGCKANFKILVTTPKSVLRFHFPFLRNSMYANGATIFDGECKPNPIPVMDPKVTLSYGALQFAELGKKLASSNLELKSNALSVLFDSFKTSKNVAEGMSFGIMKNLLVLLKDPLDSVRMDAIRVILQSSKQTAGRTAILDKSTKACIRENYFWIHIKD